MATALQPESIKNRLVYGVDLDDGYGIFLLRNEDHEVIGYEFVLGSTSVWVTPEVAHRFRSFLNDPLLGLTTVNEDARL